MINKTLSSENYFIEFFVRFFSLFSIFPVMQAITDFLSFFADRVPNRRLNKRGRLKTIGDRRWFVSFDYNKYSENANDRA